MARASRPAGARRTREVDVPPSTEVVGFPGAHAATGRVRASSGPLLLGYPSTRCRRQPGGEDVAGCVDVCVGLMPAGPASERRLALAVVRAGVPAGRAT